MYMRSWTKKKSKWWNLSKQAKFLPQKTFVAQKRRLLLVLGGEVQKRPFDDDGSRYDNCVS
jgi:hypothetical protein